MIRERLRKLGKILKLETRKRENIQRELAVWSQQAASLNQQIDELEKEQTAALDSSPTDLSARLSLLSLVEQIRNRKSQLNTELDQVQGQVELKRGELNKQHAKVKSWERVIERTRAEWDQEQRRLEMVEADERYLSQQPLNQNTN